MIKRILQRTGFYKDRKHANVGALCYSDYFQALIEVTAYNDDNDWYFKFISLPTAYGEVLMDYKRRKEIKAMTPFSYFDNYNRRETK